MDALGIPEKMILFPSAIGCVNAWSKTKNQNEKLEVSGNPATRRISLLKWNLANGLIPENLKKANLILEKNYEKSPGILRLKEIKEKWNPESLTYSKMPKTAAKSAISAQKTINGWVFSGPELTDLVRSWLENPEKNNGVAILADSAEGYAGIANKKRKRPTLQLWFKKETK